MKDPVLSLIPYPNQLTLTGDYFQWSAAVLLSARQDFKPELDLFISQLPRAVRPTWTELNKEESAISIQVFQNEYEIDGYQLKIEPDRITISADSNSGVFYALQSFQQLISAAYLQTGSSQLDIPCLVIHDQPRFQWRGFMLDEARHFQGKETVLLLLDWMAQLKMNVFHWHLSDDQGWRIEIKSHPQLTEVGSVRTATQSGGFLSRKVVPGIHQGFYTQEDIQQIVQYASERYITIVPEFDLPGHSSAILAAYPNLGCTGGPYQVKTRWGIHKDILCAGNPDTLPFLEFVFTEVLDLFPGQYIHIGGDEAPKACWRSCPKCRALAEQSGFKDVEPLQTLMSNQISRFLQQHGRSMMGWNELIDEDLDPQIAIQFWRGDKKALLSQFRRGRKTVLSNFEAYYLDHAYVHSPLEKVYRFEAVPHELEKQFHNNVLGIEAPLWTEFVPNRAQLDWQVFPRLLAVAESAWTNPGLKDYRQFLIRLQPHLEKMEQAGIGYAGLEAADPGRFKRLGGLLSLFQEGKGVREGLADRNL